MRKNVIIVAALVASLGGLAYLLLMGYWNISSEKQPMSANAVAQFRHAHPVFRVVFSPDGKTLFSGTYDRREGSPAQRTDLAPSIWGWDVLTKENSMAFSAHEGRVFSLAVAPDGLTLASAGDDRTSRFWDLTKKEKTPRLLREFPGQYCAVYAPDGKTLASVDRDFIYLWDVSSGKEIRRWTANSACLVAFSPDGTRVVSASGLEAKARMWDVATGREMRHFHGSNNFISMAFSPDGQTFVGGGSRVRFFVAASGQERNGRPNTAGICAPHLAFSPDGRTLAAAGGSDKAVYLWETATGRERCRFHGHERWIINLAFSPDGRLLASASEDRTVILWNLLDPTVGAKLSPEECNVLWHELAGEALAADRAIKKLTAAGSEVVPFLKKQLQKALSATKSSTSKEVALLIKDLRSDRLAVRQKASQDLEELGESVLPVLRQFLDKAPPGEESRHIELLLHLLPRSSSFSDWKPFSSNDLRILRVQEVLENIGSNEATELLEMLTVQAPDLRLALDAEAAKLRLSQRKSNARPGVSGEPKN